MGGKLTGIDARIWELHMQGFPASRISALVGVGEPHVKAVVCSAWRDDKLAGQRARRR